MIRSTTRSNQSGAALVVGLILLVAISIMSIATMNTASLDLIMAGNEQFHSRAFVAAEVGIERAWTNNSAYSTSANYPTAGYTTPATTGVGNDSFNYRVTRPGGGAVDPPPPGNSAGTFGAIYFSIESRGSSERGALATNTQELFQVVKAPDDLPNMNCGANTSLYATGSTC